MANILKNQLYPHVKQSINEYLHGFSKEKIDIQLSKGEVTLEKISLRPDTINNMLDEQNIPFWIKVGLIKKITLGASVLSVIGEIPLEVVIDGVDIMLSPSYKWIIKNIENFINNNNEHKDTPNPLGNDIFNKKPDDFDTSIFNVEKIQEIFKDKTILSNIINNLFKSLYTFYNIPNFVAVIKIKNVHLRFEDDELMNYTGDIALGMKISLLQIKLGCKGNMKKDSIKLKSLDIYWENNAKILISSNFLNGCIKNGKLQEKYYTNLKNVHFDKFQYLPNTKFIIQDFNLTINLGTRDEKLEDIDIFDIKTTPSMVYFQLASNELNINLYPEIAKIQNNFTEFLAQFPIIEKVKDYRPFIKPSEKNSMDYINLIENYRKNVIDNKDIKKKLLVRDWINYFYWFQKSKKGEKTKVINPIRTEFVRFYNICFKKVDLGKLKKEKKKEKEMEKEKEKEKVKTKKEEPKKDKEKVIYHKKKVSKEKGAYIAGVTPMGDENEEENPTPGETPFGDENETPTPGETPEGDENEEELIIPKELDFSSRIDLLIKGLNVNLYSPLSGNAHDYISLSVAGIEVKIRLTGEKFDFNFKIKTIDLGPSNLNMGQRVIIQPKSYRKAIPEQNMTSINSNIPYGNLSTYNYVSLPNSNLGSRITGLIKKYNPDHEQKIKVIDEALELAESHSRVVSLAASEMGDYKLRSPNRLRNKTPFGGNEGHNLGQSTNFNMTDLGKTYGSVFVPRNVSFAKNLIDNYEGNSLQNKKYERKKNNELNISQAINDYNSYKNQEKLKVRTSRSPTSSLSSSHFNLRESQFGIMPNSMRGKNIPLNLLEIFSNTEVGALSFSFTKYNNPITLDNLSFQIGTIRLNMFTSYLLDILRILSEYKKATSIPKITTSEGDFSPDGKTILDIQEYFYNYILKKIPDSEKTDSMLEYMEYLKKEINSKKKFSSKPEHFIINQIFSFFPKGFDFHFDYENIEVVAYDSNNIVSSKIIVPSSELIVSLSFTKIFVKLLELEVEVTDLNRCETILEQLKDLAKDKFKVVQIVIEPCYKQIKDGIEPLLKDTNKEFKQILKNQNSSNNMSQSSPKNSQRNISQNSPQNINPNYIQNVQENSPQEKSISQNYLQNINENSPQDKSISHNMLYNINENSPQNKNISQNYSQNINESSPKDKSINQNSPNYISMNQNSPQSQNLLNNEEEEDNNEEFESNNIQYNMQIEEKSNNDKQSFIKKQKEQQEMLYRRQKEKENEILMQNRKEKELMLKRQQQEREKEQEMQLQKQKDSMLKQQQLERQQKLLILKQQQQEKRQKELVQNQLQLEQQKIAEAQLQQNQYKKNKSQTQLNLQQKKSIHQEQQKQELLLRQQQQKTQNKNVKKKNAKKPAPLANSPKNTDIQNSDEDDQKIPKDTQRTNKRFIGKKKDGRSHYNIYINTNNNKNNDLPQMKRENSGASYNQMGHINPQIQTEYTTYNAGTNIRKKGNNNIKYNIKPNINKSGNIYLNNKQNSSYLLKGNHSQIINNNF